jgi:hypothetical protein
MRSDHDVEPKGSVIKRPRNEAATPDVRAPFVFVVVGF